MSHPTSRLLSILGKILPKEALNEVGLTKILIALILSYKLQQPIILLITSEYSSSLIRIPFMVIPRLADIYLLPILAWTFLVANYILKWQHKPTAFSDPKLLHFRIVAVLFGIMLFFNLMEAPPSLRSQYMFLIFKQGIPIIFMFFCLRDHDGMRFLLGTMTFWGITISIAYIALGISPLTAARLLTMAERLTIGENPITAGISFCLGSLSCLLSTLSLRNKKAKRLYLSVLLGSAIYLFSCSLLTASRGPVVAFAVSVLVVIILRCKVSGSLVNSKSIYLSCFVFGILLLSYFLTYKVDVLSGRFTLRSDERVENIVYAFTSEPTLFGQGVGGFMQNTSLAYIHSCFAESYYEHGIVGLFLYVSMVCCTAFVHYKRYSFFSDIPSMFLLILFIFYVVESQFSGTLYDFMPLWALFTISAVPLAIKQIRSNDARFRPLRMHR